MYELGKIILRLYVFIWIESLGLIICNMSLSLYMRFSNSYSYQLTFFSCTSCIAMQLLLLLLCYPKLHTFGVLTEVNLYWQGFLWIPPPQCFGNSMQSSLIVLVRSDVLVTSNTMKSLFTLVLLYTVNPI